ncbi:MULTISPECIES: DUF4476 domain-containing protein [unclassified Capnocytophaga]|jgi:hypothetical protein|uniref:DUF4476 domain-containing protein n=1 Tax=unclassified Capnocytophaga TaxID=2640652 RepID=UPI000202E8E3|nr:MULTISPECIES: DUF4476 domain-containing protein [unclassified Capnocytophaga]EGD34862.1 hypothetical protein HMPREF9071_0554 [Capnocytophaga sp. oral taxon 338 str. F0234]MEB3004599.1 DUF4476 domain-containing protein [Capnocytophaga sp. G2]
MRIITIVCLLLTQGLFAQEAGKIGKLLRNEAKASDINSVHIQLDIQGGEYKRPNLQQYRTSPGQYQWNPAPYGYSEVFLRIPDNGYFTVTLADQQISGYTGKFRFFDVRSGAVPLSIYLNGFLVYQTTLMAQQNSRTVLDYFVQYGLYELAVYPIEKQWYGGDWNDIWNNPYQAGHSIGGNPHLQVMPDDVYANFYRALSKFHFDSDRTAFINQQRNTAYTCAQIKPILALYSFDKLQMAKHLYTLCADKGNFFTVYDVFNFDSDRNALMDFVAKYRE